MVQRIEGLIAVVICERIAYGRRLCVDKCNEINMGLAYTEHGRVK